MPHTDEYALAKYLRKCELQYRADHTPTGECVEWLASYCNSLEDIVVFLRDIGFKVKEIMDDKMWDGDMRWVVTTSGVIVYENDEFTKGLVAKATDRR